MIIGATALIYNYVLGEHSGIFFLIWGGLFFWGGLSGCYAATIGSVRWKKKTEILNQHNLAWYKSSYPQYVLSSNIVQCCFCQNKSLGCYLLKNRTYKVCHYCAKCGEVLYYTDEH